MFLDDTHSFSLKVPSSICLDHFSKAYFQFVSLGRMMAVNRARILSEERSEYHLGKFAYGGISGFDFNDISTRDRKIICFGAIVIDTLHGHMSLS
jgi:hypothetical protein